MASPPVVKFLDFGQYKYDLTKREKEAKRKQRSVTFKEVRLSPKIGIGDFDTKVHRAIEFLEDGDRIKVTVRFRGRELTHPELGRGLLAQVRGSSQGARGPGAGAASRGQVDAHHDGIAPQAQDARRTDQDTRRTGGRRGSDPAGSGSGRDQRGNASGDGSGGTASSRGDVRRIGSRPAAAPPGPAPAPGPVRRSAGPGRSGSRASGGRHTRAETAIDKTSSTGTRAGADRRVRPGCPRSRATRRPRSASA